MKFLRSHSKIVILLLLVLMYSCGSTISLFDHYSYQQTTALKIDALELMSLAIDPIEQHEAQVKSVETALRKMQEYEKHRPKNEITAKMWHTLLDTAQGSFGGFMKRWRNDSRQGSGLGRVYIENRSIQISRDFDQIIELVSKKIK